MCYFYNLLVLFIFVVVPNLFYGFQESFSALVFTEHIHRGVNAYPSMHRGVRGRLHYITDTVRCKLCV